MGSRQGSGKSEGSDGTGEGLRARTASIIKILETSYPDARTALHHSLPHELLIATILSAQCTDKRVNLVTPGLFRRYPTVQSFAAARPRELEKMIHSTGFFHAKAKNIIGCCKALMENFHGVVPQTMEELTTLPGVGRKTANVVLGSVFGRAEGVVVDTHVKRLSGRLGLSKNTAPEKVERNLLPIVPRKKWILFSHLLILHGRAVCTARSPRCAECQVRIYCPSAALFLASK
ncbi:MAG TPA: endonuclease III [Bacteroidota bacterium]|nr:endonuclease III [Bacteroidota bacterium]